MADHYPPVNPRCPHLLHGGDYNPEQWVRTPEIWDQDMRLMKLAGCNAMSVGVFSWSALEPEEGRFEFGWLDTIMNKLAAEDAFALLATPSGARPAWLSHKYPEVNRVGPDRRRNLHGDRHNHCTTSPVYREKCMTINRALAERYKGHPALLIWHVSNEYGGECHCDLCQEAFRQWLRRKYQDNLDDLNHAWWASFWSHTFTDWSQIASPSPIGERLIHGMNLDWRRFVTDQTLDFFRDELAPLRAITPEVPVTTNFMGTYAGLNYWKFIDDIDVASWNSYPMWHAPGSDVDVACGTAFVHDLYRSLKDGKPFLLTESVPSKPNWMDVCKTKRPGVHLLSSLQAVAHGSDSVLYFQWRKSRGSIEKFHGAVVDHVGHENTRVFRDVADVGEALKRLSAVVGATAQPLVAVLYDWENAWAIDDLAGLGRETRKYQGACVSHYRAFWSRGTAVDVIDQTRPFDKYRLLVAPMLYMLRPGVAERIEKFVAAGGTLVTTYWSGIVDENDLCLLGGCPGLGLRQVLGIWDEEIDSLYPDDRNTVLPAEGNRLGLVGPYEAREFCGLIHSEGAEVLASYGEDFYAGRPALTVHQYGQGRAYYIASRNDRRFLADFYGALAGELGLGRALDADLPEGVTAQMRSNGRSQFVFLMNFTPQPQGVDLGEEELTDLLVGGPVGGLVELAPYGVRVLSRRQ